MEDQDVSLVETPGCISGVLNTVLEQAVRHAIESNVVLCIACTSSWVAHRITTNKAFQDVADLVVVTDVKCERSTPMIIVCSYSKVVSLVKDADVIYLLDAHLVATFDHVVNINRVCAEAAIFGKSLKIFCGGISSLRSEELTLIQEFEARYGKVATTMPLDKGFVYPNEVTIQCDLSTGVEVISGELSGFQQLNVSSCPITDALLSVLDLVLRTRESAIVLCNSELEAINLAERVSVDLGELLADYELPSANYTLFDGIKLVGNVAVLTVSPFGDVKDHSMFRQKVYPIIFAERRLFLYYGYRCSYVINMVYSKNRNPATEAERLNMLGLVCETGGHYITITDSARTSLVRFPYRPNLLFKVVHRLLDEARIQNIEDAKTYLQHLFVQEVNAHEAVSDLLRIGSVSENNGCLEQNPCRYLAGYAACEKYRLLADTYQGLDLSDKLYLLFIANAYFVNQKDISRNVRDLYLRITKCPSILGLHEKVGLNAPFISRSKYDRLDAAVVIASVLYYYYENDATPESSWCADLKEITHLQELSERNLSRTSRIVKDYFGSLYENIFLHYESVCKRFRHSPFRTIPGLDVMTVYLLAESKKVKTVADLAIAQDINNEIRPLATKKKISVKLLAQQIREAALKACEIKKQTAADSNKSFNASRNLFGESFTCDDTIEFLDLCVQNLVSLDLIFSYKNVAVLHVHESGLVTMVLFGDIVSLHTFDLNCCSECDNDGRTTEILIKLESVSRIFVIDSIVATRVFVNFELPPSIPDKAHCLTIFGYMIGQNGLEAINPRYHILLPVWKDIYNNVIVTGAFTTYNVRNLVALMPVLNELSQNTLMTTVRKAFLRMSTMYVSGINYSGYDDYVKRLQTCYNDFPVHVKKAVESPALDKALIEIVADDVDELLETKRFKKARLTSRAVATRNQTSAYYTNVLNARRIKQALELLNREVFGSDSGYIYPNFHFRGNRVYTSNPNVQNFPKNLPCELLSPRALIWSGKADYQVWSADYSEIELRVAAALTEDYHLLKAVESPDAFSYISQILNLTSYDRSDVKMFFYGLMYGMGPETLQKEHGLGREASYSLVETFWATFDGLHAYRRLMIEKTLQCEIICDYFGRPIATNPDAAYATLNGIIQSTATYILLQGISKIPENVLLSILFVVHDEMVFSAPKSYAIEACHMVATAMEYNMRGVSFPVRFSVGSNWGNLKRIDWHELVADCYSSSSF